MTLLEGLLKLHGGRSIPKSSRAENALFPREDGPGQSGQVSPSSHGALASPTSQQRAMVLSDCVVRRCDARKKLSSFKVEVSRP